MQIIIQPTGNVRCVYDETIDVSRLGRVVIRRASHVEPDNQGHWMADLAPVEGPKLGPFALRSQALDAERRWLQRRWLRPRGH